MKLSASILANKLKSKFALQSKKMLTDELHLEQVLFYNDGDEMLPHKIYIYIQDPEVPQEVVVPAQSVLFCAGDFLDKTTTNTV